MAVDFTQMATDMMSQLGYAGMVIGLVVDSFGIPIPSEVLLTIGGALAAAGRFDPWVVFVLGVVAQVVGASIGYIIGRYGGNPFLERYGKYVLISKKDLHRTYRAFDKYGAWLTLVGRCLPLIRGLVAYPAGIAKMKVSTFLVFTVLGSTLWSAIFVYLGYTLSENLGVVNDWMHQLSLVVVLAIAAAVLWHLREYIGEWWSRQRKKDQ